MGGRLLGRMSRKGAQCSRKVAYAISATTQRAVVTTNCHASGDGGASKCDCGVGEAARRDRATNGFVCATNVLARSKAVILFCAPRQSYSSFTTTTMSQSFDSASMSSASKSSARMYVKGLSDAIKAFVRSGSLSSQPLTSFLSRFDL